MPDEPVQTSVTSTVPVTTPVPVAVVPPVAAAAPSTVTIPLDQLQAFTAMQARLATIEAEGRQREAQVEADKATAMIKRGEIESALALMKKQSDDQLAAERGKLAATEERAKRYALDGELARVLANQPLIPHAALHLTKLWRSEFNVVPAGDSFNVQTPTLQSVEAFVVAQLATPEYSAFVRAQNPGGGTGAVAVAGQTTPTPNAQTGAPPEIKTLSDAVIYHMKNMKTGTGDGRTDPSVSFGLKRQA
jgi:hypothetical protein